MKYKTLARLLVRGAGLLLIAQTIPNCMQTSFAIGVDWLARDGGAARGASVWWSDWRLAYLVDSVVRFTIGAALFLRPNWVANLLIPSNRLYCHECGYELGGSPVEGDCPECGTAYKMRLRQTAAEVSSRPDQPAPPVE